MLEGETTSSGELNQIHINTTPFCVGRRSSNNLTISNRTVSSRHAEFLVEDGQLMILDHDSTNGTFLNGKRVRSISAVADGDVVHFGKARFHVRCSRDSNIRATMAFDAEGDAIAHLQFPSLWDGESLTPHFQPIVRISDQKILAFEALARSPLPGLENPFTMFQIAQQHQAEAELSELLRETSLKQAQPILEHHAIYVNTHPQEIGKKELLKSLDRLRTDYPKADIVMEIHESGTASIPYLQELKRKLGELEMKLAYDDFGRGQSRLNALAEVTPDIVKFDMELVRGLHRATNKRRRFVRSLLKIVKALNGITLAEGVEEPEEANACEELGFELAQGYYYGRPNPIHYWVENPALIEETQKVH